MTYDWARNYVRELDSSVVIQHNLAIPENMAGVRTYADVLRRGFPDIPDIDIGRMMAWVADFLVFAMRMEGSQNVTPDNLMVTFALIARDLVHLESEVGGE